MWFLPKFQISKLTLSMWSSFFNSKMLFITYLNYCLMSWSIFYVTICLSALDELKWIIFKVEPFFSNYEVVKIPNSKLCNSHKKHYTIMNYFYLQCYFLHKTLRSNLQHKFTNHTRFQKNAFFILWVIQSE